MGQADEKVTKVSDKARYERQCRCGKERYNDLDDQISPDIETDSSELEIAC